MKRQLTHTYSDIISLENLLAAWQEFVVGKRKKKDVQEFSLYLMDNIVALHTDLANKTYCHGTYESFYINDPKRRHIHKASVRDRLLHHAVYRILYPFFDRTFIADSFSCRNDKGMHKAIDRFRAYAYKVSHNHIRTCWVLKCDIKQFFASINHDILWQILREYIPDAGIMGLLKNVIGSFQTPRHLERNLPQGDAVERSRCLQNDHTLLQCNTFGIASHGRDPSTSSLRSVAQDDVLRVFDHGVGLPLGNLTSQLFTNIYMNHFDQWVKHHLKATHYIRYADDFVFLSHDKQHLMDSVAKIQDFLSTQLHLTIHPKKISLCTVASGIDYLGWVHFPNHRVLRETTKRRMLARVKEHSTNETVQSYLGLLSHGNTNGVRRQLLSEQWLWQ